MTTPRHEHLVDWLRNAHAMEQQADTFLRKTASRLEHYPDLRQRIELHIDETRSQSDRLEQEITRLGGDTSGVKDLMASAMASMHAMGNAFQPDEVVKGAGFGYAFEHFEIAQYNALIVAAESCGEPETARVCREILKEEEAMAAWLFENLGPTVRAFLERDEVEHDVAKR